MDQIWVVSEKTRQWGPSVSFTLNLEVTPHSLQLLRYSQKSSGTHSDYSHFPLCTTCAGWEMKNQVLDTKGVSVVKGRGVGVEHRPYLCHLPDITLWHAHQGSLHCGIEKWQYFFVFFLPHNTAYGILVPWPGIKPTSPALESWSRALNHQGNPKRGTFETTLLKVKNRIFTSKN